VTVTGSHHRLRHRKTSPRPHTRRPGAVQAGGGRSRVRTWATTGPTLQRSRPRTRMSCSIAESWSLADSPTRNSNAVRRSGLAAHLAEQIHGLSSPGMGKPQRARLPALDVADGTRTTGLSSGMIARPEWSWPRRCTAWPLPRRSPRPILTPVQGPMTRPHAARGGEAPTHCVTGAATGGPSPPAIRRAAWS